MDKKQKTKTQLLREIQNTVDEFLKKKDMVDSLLEEIEELEKKYHSLKREAKGK